MKNFKELGIKSEAKGFVGDKIKINKILNREIVVTDYRIAPSPYTEKRLDLQIELNGTKYVVFTGSKHLIELIVQVAKEDFPFKTTIVQENERYEFT